MKLASKIFRISAKFRTDSAKSWIAEEPDIYTFLLDRKKAKAHGYINAMPVTDDCFEAIMRGKNMIPTSRPLTLSSCWANKP